MNADWNQFLQQTGSASERETTLCPLTQWGLIAATGADAEAFLQGQLSNDVRRVAASTSQLAAYCSPKGRILALARLFLRDQDYYWVLPRERLAPVLQRLRLFVLRAQVKLHDASDELSGLGLNGPHAAALLEQSLSVAAPSEVDAVIQHHGVTVLRVPGEQPRFMIFAPGAALTALWRQLAPHAQAVGAHTWRLLDIRAGIPNVYNATADAFVPQMVNLHKLNGIDFQKGCYVGQEVIARTQYLGQLKRHMVRARLAGAAALQPGTELYALYSLQEPGPQPVGQIVDACPHPDGGWELLAVVVSEAVAGTAAARVPIVYDPVQGESLRLAPWP